MGEIDDEIALLAPTNLQIYYLTALSCIGGFLFGYDTGVISGALILLDDDFKMSDFQKEVVVGVTVGGAFVAATLAGKACDRFGRSPVILFSSLVFFAGSLILAFADSYDMLIVGRIVVGLGVGAASMSMPIYVGEAAPTEIRGFLVTCINVAITFGQFFSSCIDGGFAYVPHGWRYMLGLAAFPAILQFVGFLFLPESPRWLLEQGKTDMAIMALQRLREKDDVRDEVGAIIESIRDEREKEGVLFSETTSDPLHNFRFRSTVSKLFEKSTFRALLIGSSLQAAQQFSGINTVMYYSATILQLAGFSSTTEAIWLSAVVSFFNFVGSLIGLSFVEKIGRRKLTLISLFFVSVFLGLISLSFYFAEKNSGDSSATMLSGSCSQYHYCFDCIQDDGCGFCTSIPFDGSFYAGCIPNSGSSDRSTPLDPDQCPNFRNDYFSDSCPYGATYGWIIFVALCLYLLSFAPGMGPMPWCINSEIFPTSIRGVGNSISTSVNWSSNLIMSLTFLTISNALSTKGAFALYGGIAFLFLALFYFFLPETKGTTLEKISILFDDHHWGKAHSFPRNISNSSKDPKSLTEALYSGLDHIEADEERETI